MRRYLFAISIAAGLGMPPALVAQHESAEATHGRHEMMMMMGRHHSAAAVDSLLAYRDSLQLTEGQVERLVLHRERMGHQESHPMMGMNHQGMNRQWARVRYDRVPGKMVPRSRRDSHDCCENCPLMVLDSSQRERAHRILGHRHQG